LLSYLTTHTAVILLNEEQISKDVECLDDGLTVPVELTVDPAANPVLVQPDIAGTHPQSTS